MEWAIGVFVAIVVFACVGTLIDATTTGNNGLAPTLAFVGALAVYAAFGLVFEIADEAALLKVENGKVMESQRRMLLAWDAPSYVPGVRQFNGAYVTRENLKVSYKIYYRIVDEDLGETQKYYDEVVVKRNNNLFAVLNELVLVVQRDNPATLSELRVTAVLFMYPYGIKVMGVE